MKIVLLTFLLTGTVLAATRVPMPPSPIKPAKKLETPKGAQTTAAMGALMVRALVVVPPSRLYTNTTTASWDYSPTNQPASFRVYVGLASRNYTATFPSTQLSRVISISHKTTDPAGYLAVTAVNALGMESGYSGEAIWIFYPPWTKVRLTRSSTNPVAIQSSTDLKNWSTVVAGFTGTTITNAIQFPSQFFRSVGTGPADRWTITPLK